MKRFIRASWHTDVLFLDCSTMQTCKFPPILPPMLPKASSPSQVLSSAGFVMLFIAPLIYKWTLSLALMMVMALCATVLCVWGTVQAGKMVDNIYADLIARSNHFKTYFEVNIGFGKYVFKNLAMTMAATVLFCALGVFSFWEVVHNNSTDYIMLFNLSAAVPMMIICWLAFRPIATVYYYFKYKASL